MKALVIRQPWAAAIMDGHKRFENRTWSTRYRGPLVIVAGSSRSSLTSGTAFCRERGYDVPADLPFGCILGIVQLTNILLPSDCGGDPFTEGPYCWRLESPVKLERPVPFRGRLGLFSIDEAAARIDLPQFGDPVKSLGLSRPRGWPAPRT